ncbi:MAG TPA: hypothetical protein VFC78_00170 [Tepidisphaeraceae bacterium]|nr:hypothetical protein [Tepidisphaeraceae bacterium]
MNQPLASTPTTQFAISRRSFVKAAAGVTAAYAVPNILRAQDKAGAKTPVLGSGQHTYELVPGWGQLPDGKRYGNTHAVIETEDGRIFIHNASPTGDATCIFDPDGKFIKSWGKQFAGGAHGMDIRKEGNEEFLYLAPTGMHKVFKTTLDGQVVMELDYPKMARDVKDGKIVPDYNGPDHYVPTFIALPPNGDFYVTDGYGSNYVHRYDNKGGYIQSWGGPGSEPGKMRCPHGIWCDTRNPAEPTIVVADRANVRLQWFTLDGKLIKIVDKDLRHPCHFSQRGTDLLIPDLKGRVTIIDKDNNLIAQLGDNPNKSQWANNGVKPQDLKPGIFCTPHGATWDHLGNAYIVEWLPYGRVTKLKRV